MEIEITTNTSKINPKFLQYRFFKKPSKFEFEKPIFLKKWMKVNLESGDVPPMSTPNIAQKLRAEDEADLRARDPLRGIVLMLLSAKQNVFLEDLNL